MYEEIVKALRNCDFPYDVHYCRKCVCQLEHGGSCDCRRLFPRSADAIEELLKSASAMHTWIFLHTGDEQSAYDECGLTDEMNAELGYGGQFVIDPPKEET